MSEQEDFQDEDGDSPKLTHGVIIGLLKNAKFYKSEEGWGFVDAVAGGVRWSSVLIHSRRFDALVYSLVEQLPDMGFPTKRMMEDVRAWALAQIELAQPRSVTHRVNQFGDKLVYDLATPGGDFVVWEDGRWEVRHGIWPFMRGDATRAQVLPVKTDKKLVDLMRPLVNCSEDDLQLVCGWLLGCFKVGGPYPVLALNGMQGSAKTTTTRLLKRMIDPHGLSLSDPPKGASELLALMRNRFLLAFDNLSFVNANFSDLLCKVATKATIQVRELYSNGNEVGIEATRPVIINGIPTFTDRPDLVDRMVQVTLRPISRDSRMTDDKYWARVDSLFPELLGALYNAVGDAQFNSRSYELPSSHRMANFLHWSASSLGKPFLDAYDKAMKHTVSDAIESNSFTLAIIMMMREMDTWTGTLGSLLAELGKYRALDDQAWPQTTKGAAAMLKRYRSSLRAACIDVQEAGREQGGGYRRTLYRFKRTAEWASLEFSSEVSVV